MWSRMTPIATLALLFVGVVTNLTTAQAPPQAGEQHQGLANEVGIWDAETKIWMAPGMDPMTSKATETNKMLGKMWLISEFKGDMAGMPFTGQGQFGYDPAAKKYIGTWIDTFSPYLSVMEGTMEGNKLTMISKGRDAMTGKETITKMVSTYTDEDHKTFEMFSPVEGKDGEWWKMMEVSYTRRK